MSNKNYRNDRYDKYSEMNDDFEDFGYEVKNIRRQTKKKVTKFKRETDEYYDTFWTVHLIPTASRYRVLYTCWRDFLMLHPLQTMSFEDREMLTYQQRKQQQLAAIAPELRIKYCFEFLTGYIQDCDDEMKKRCYNGIAKYIELVDTAEYHYWSN